MDLQDLRAKIDEIDDGMVELRNNRLTFESRGN